MKVYKEMLGDGSEGTTKDIDNTDKGGGIPLDCNSAIHFVIPIAGSRKVESTVSFLHDDTIGDILEILVDSGDCLQYLRHGLEHTSSQI